MAKRNLKTKMAVLLQQQHQNDGELRPSCVQWCTSMSMLKHAAQVSGQKNIPGKPEAFPLQALLSSFGGMFPGP